MSSDTTGFIAAGIACLCFGSNFVPVKKYETGDGIFFQWVLCIAVWVVGCILNIARTVYSDGLISSIEFYPFAMLGGALWCIGNAMAVTIIKCIGLGLGMAIWGCTNLLMGWACGKYGFLGIQSENIAHPWLNYAGVILAVVGVCVFCLIKTESSPEIKTVREDERYLLSDPYRVNETPQKSNESFVEKMPPSLKRIVGILLSAISGAFYGVNFNPPTYIIQKIDGKGLDFVFSHFTGILLMSTLLMAIYCFVKGNKPDVYPNAILPGMLSGFLWAIAQCCYFVANQDLGFVLSFPLISTGPGLIANLWGVLVFREIRGTQNFIFLGSGFAIIITAVTMIALSNKQDL